MQSWRACWRKPSRHPNVFRDKKDMRGSDYFRAIEGHLLGSRKLVVLCSPRARASEFVSDEIRRFAAERGAEHIIPVVVEGIPNNEAPVGQEARMAFPEALTAVMSMPLAISYLDCDPGKDRVDAESYLDPWYTLLTNVFEISRSELEQRDQQKRARDRRALSTEWAAKALQSLEDDPELAALLAVQSALATYLEDGVVTRETEELLHLAQSAVIRKRTTPLGELAGHNAAVWRVAISPGDELLITVSEDCTMKFWDAETLLERWTQPVNPPCPIKAVAFSPDGQRFATAQFDGSAKLWETVDGRGLGRSDHAGPVWDVVFSPDGSPRIATASLDGSATVWDLTTGEIVVGVYATPDTFEALGELVPMLGRRLQPGRSAPRYGREIRRCPGMGRGDRGVARPSRRSHGDGDEHYVQPRRRATGDGRRRRHRSCVGLRYRSGAATSDGQHPGVPARRLQFRRPPTRSRKP